MEGGPNIQVSVIDDENLCDKCYFTFCHPNGKGHRFIALIFMCFLGFGSYFCYDNPGALQEQVKSDLNITEKEFTVLYSIYSWPNVIMCFFGGFLIDRVFGIRMGTNIFMGLTLLGQIFFAFGAFWSEFWLMLIGRFIFGIGAESLAVAQNNYAVLWFKGKELNMVFGLQLSFARVGSTVNFWVMEPIYKWLSDSSNVGTHVLGVALLIAAITCIFSMVCSLVLGFLDKRSEVLTRRAEVQSTEIVKITDVKDFKVTFWFLTVICVTYYIAIFPFISVGQDFFEKRFDMNDVDADRINSLIYLISGASSPLTGFLIDKTGLNILWILVSVILTIIAHTLLGFTLANPYIGVVILGIAYSVLSSGLWPLVALIVPEYQLGTAYGVCQSIQNLGLAVTTNIAGLIITNWGYGVLSECFIASLFMAFVFTSIMLLIDQAQNGTLNMTPTGRRQYQETLRNNLLERERLIDAEEGSSETNVPAEEEQNGITQSLSSDDARFRNRYLNKIGAELPPS